MTKTNIKYYKNIAFNKRGYYDFFVKKELEAGLVLQGWEVKSLREAQVNITKGYIIVKNGEAFLIGVNIKPITTILNGHVFDSMRTRKLLLNQYELKSIYGSINRGGYSVIALSLYWKKVWCKIKIGIVKGKKKHDKRLSLKEREWNFKRTRIKNITL